jgi:L-asparaginase II/GNAT superfamily N-acetyltransferase
MGQALSTSRRASLTDPHFEPVAAIVRGSYIESVHRGAIAVVDAGGRLLGTVGEPNADLLMRSSAKPFQALALVETGAAEALGITTQELAIVCGSHSGRGEHVAVVGGLLKRLGAPEDCLVWGSLAHMCSGKHVGMIALAVHLGVPWEGYEEISHPVQQTIARTIAALLSDRLADGLLVGVDGCGVPMVRLSVRDAAYLYARLAVGAIPGLATVRDAMLAYPAMVAGEGRFDTNVMRAAEGRVISKSGAEGIQALAMLPGGHDGDDGGDAAGAVGCMMKIEDGSSRAFPALSRAFLQSYGVDLPEEAFAARIRTPEGLRGLGAASIEPLVSAEHFKRTWNASDNGGDGRASRTRETTVFDADTKLSVCRGTEREIARFLADEWPEVDEENFGKALRWYFEAHSLVIRRKRRIIAVLKGHFIGGIGSVDELMVGKESRGRGFGSLLLDQFEEEAQRRGCSRVVLRAVKAAASEDFYHSRGYRRECVEWSHEFGFDYVRLTRELPWSYSAAEQ